MKRESYRNSEFAMRVLADHGIPVVMKVHFQSVSLYIKLLILWCTVRPPCREQQISNE